MFKKILRYELARLKNNRTMLIVLGVSVVLVFAAIALIYWLAPTETIIAENREAAFNTYQRWLFEYKEALGETSGLSAKAYLMREIERFEFFLRTNTIHTDYLKFGYYNYCKFEGFEGIGFLFAILSFGMFAYAVYAMFCALYMISEEKREGSLKNLLASDIPKNKLFLYKLAIYGALAIIPYLILAMIIGIAGAFVPHGNFLVYTTHFEAVSGYAILWQMIFTDLAIAAVIFAVTLLLSVFLRQIPCIALTVSGYLAVALLDYVIQSKAEFLPLGSMTIRTAAFIPITGLQTYGLDGMVLNPIYFLLFAVNIAIAAIIIIISAKQFNKRNI